jgi:transposase
MEEQKRKRRNYPDEFKAEAVALVDRGDRSLVQVAKDLGVHPTVLRAWKRKARVEASGGGAEGSLTTAEREELVRLRRRVRSLEEDREILKKAAAFFAKEMP